MHGLAGTHPPRRGAMTESLSPRRYVALVALIVMLVSVGTFLFRVRGIFAYTLDDSFITFRYAMHAARGEGLTWNVGERPPTEGCTSFLWLMILSLAFHLQTDMEVAAKVLGIACILTTAALVFVSILRSARGPGVERAGFPAACLGVSLLLMNAHLPAHAVSGMETAAALMLLTALLVLLAEYLRQPRAMTACGIGVTALLLGLTRPELNLAACVALILTLALAVERARLVVYGLAPYAAGGVIYFLWRWSYFELPFPLPFYVKQMGHGLLPGFRPTLAYAIYLWPLYPLLAFFTLRLFREHREWLPAVAAVVATVIYFIFPAHIMGGDYRFVFPTYGVVAVFAGLGFSPLVNRLSWRRPFLLAGLIVILGLFVVQQQARYRHVMSTALTDARGLNVAHIPLGKTLAAIDPRGQHLLAISDAGAVPYYSGWRTIDTFGLNNREIALSLRSGYDPERVVSSHPDLIVLISNTRDGFDPPLPFEGLILTACQTQGYRRIGTLTYSEGYYLWLMVRDEAMANAVRAALIGKVPAFAE